ncbi:unnamed protein product [Acanthoscelides obtectus]|uniref:Protein eyes shut n=1 Tax=Acanthoscelides obtectus TaxID=200917 RepID=A0A9P0PCV5_ACAOB|nr:unnamed protein product [Acanthoscelides obtectus]CAK1669257.1 Protein eyes shut [Acanthoscelides obtectus]
MPTLINLPLLLSTLLILLAPPTALSGFSCLSNPCVHGVCIDDLNSTYFCYCIDGYTGAQCQTNWNECWSSPCLNGGVCIDGIAMFYCSCAPGYTGDLCEVDINECESNPCQNNGTCLDAMNGYTCSCLPGYSGFHCEIDVAVCNATNETRCMNGGICEEGPGDSFSCRCVNGWMGLFCETEVDECLSAPCQNGAVCVDLQGDYSCACLFGYSGRNCEDVMHICEKNPCKNGALCLMEGEHNVCYCVPDFHGNMCQYQYDECQLGPRCLNGGTCIDGVDNFTCSCPPNLTGVLCECLILQDATLDCEYIAPSDWSQTTQLTTSSYGSTSFTLSPSTSTVKVVAPISTTVETYTGTVSTTYIMDTSTVTKAETVFPNSTEFATTTKASVTNLSTLPCETSTTTTEETPFTTTKLSTLTEGFTMPEIMTTPSSPFTDHTTSEASYSFDTTIGEGSTSPRTPSVKLPTESPSAVSTEAVTSGASFTTTRGTSVTVQETTTATVTTTSQDRATNRSFQETTTVPSSLSTFLTTTPSRETTTLSGSSPETEFTTTVVESTQTTTIFAIIDCTKPETKCQNGGMCIYVDRGYKCACPFNTEGRFCEKKLGIVTAAFSGNSHLSHHLPDANHVSIQLEAKTMAEDGLLFYSITDKFYMGLYIEHGFLKFKFSCGYQTMLLSELKTSVNDGHKITIKATLDMSKDKSHCYAKIIVNNTLSMTGDQMAKINAFSRTESWLYLGGAPNYLDIDVFPCRGFVGCMGKLKISDKPVDIYNDAEDATEINECSSLPCLSNPCKNGASCESAGDDWQCSCKNGYVGRTCETSVCENNPCLFGGTCIPFTHSGYICLCPFGKRGHFCENDIKISEPFFSSTVRGLSSFVAYPFPDGIARNMEIKFRFTPTMMDQISLMLFLGQFGYHDFYSDHLSVSFVKGYIMLTWNLGSGPRRIFTSHPIKKGARDYLVRLGHSGRQAWLYVENIGNVTGRSPGNLVQLDVVPLLFIGGHSSRNFSDLPHDLPMHTGFSGCIFDIEMKSGSVVIPFHGSMKTFGRAVGQCGTTECYERNCQNDGACLHHGSTFMCLCQEGWFGPLCSFKNNFCDSSITRCSEKSTCIPQLSSYECDCPLSRTGEYCQTVENITDVSFSGRRSYISLQPIEIDVAKFHVEMEIRTLKDTGIIFFIGKENGNFLCLTLLDGFLELRIQTRKNRVLGAKPLFVRSSTFLVKAVWYRVKFGLFGQKAYLSVNNVINTGILEKTHNLIFSKEPIFIGGFADMSKFPIFASGSLPIPYRGCIRQISINDKQVPLDSKNIKDARNIVDCDGTPCGSDFCQNGGTCWLDAALNPHCSCLSPYYGERCESVQSCDEKSCRNHGICVNRTCACNVGRTGMFCETEITVQVPKLSGGGYMMVKKGGDKKRALREVSVKEFYVNFTTVRPNALILWSQKNNNFIGMGLEHGFLKLAYSIEDGNRTVIERPPYPPVNDGLWHSVVVMFYPVSMAIDGKHFAQELARYPNITTNGVFYIGNIPNINSSLIEETHGMFTEPFEGCIEMFGSNNDFVDDFNKIDGRNVDSCDLF